jgi:hypothetical protein
MFYFLNPYSFAIFVSAKNNTENEFLKENYQNRSFIKKLEVYFKYISLVGVSNMLKIYF